MPRYTPDQLKQFSDVIVTYLTQCGAWQSAAEISFETVLTRREVNAALDDMRIEVGDSDNEVVTWHPVTGKYRLSKYLILQDRSDLLHFYRAMVSKAQAAVLRYEAIFAKIGDPRIPPEDDNGHTSGATQTQDSTVPQVPVSPGTEGGE